MEDCVLLVDDDPAYRAMLGLCLRQRGYQVRLAPSGKQALERLRRKKYDRLITDAQMSPMDGFALARQAALLQPSLRIAMVSADLISGDACRLPIEKMFSKLSALDAIAAWLSQQICTHIKGKRELSWP